MKNRSTPSIIGSRLAAGCAMLCLSGCSLIGPRDEQGETASLFPPDEGRFGEADPAIVARTALAAVKADAGSERARTLEEFFRKGDYAQALEMAEDLQSLSAPGSEDLDVAGFVLGVSLFHLGLTRGGQPRHPLYVAGAVALQSWT